MLRRLVLGLALTVCGCAPAGSSPDAAVVPPTRKDAAPMADAAPKPDTAPMVDTAPVARFGLEQRPTNATCKPPASATAAAALLSQTGCVDPADPHRPASGLIPYQVASALWSDGAVKERFLALPDGARIQVGADGHWDLPVGTVLVKNFSLGGRRIETRLLTRLNEFTWKGYSYQWNDAQTDAMLLDDVVGGIKKEVPGVAGNQVWHFPSRAQCLQCHTIAAGVSLGPSTAQLNRDLRYPSGVTSNQVATLAHIGLFETAPAEPYPAALAPASDEAISVEQRARDYLQVNCSNCHRPGGSFEGIDLRAATPFDKTGLCNQPPMKGDLGVAGALRVIPGDPSKSLVLLRMRALQEGRMPQIGTSVVDPDGVAIIEKWIKSLKACP